MLDKYRPYGTLLHWGLFYILPTFSP